jgi:type I restriction enzyme, S subunit
MTVLTKAYAVARTLKIGRLLDDVRWPMVKVREAGHVQLGRQRAPQHASGKFMRPYLRVANVFEDRIGLSNVLKMNFTPKEFETFALKPNDVLLNEGQSLHLVGRAALYRGELPGACFQNTLIRFRPGPQVDPRFALLVFRWYLHSGKFKAIARWTTNIAHLGAGRFAEMPFPLPPLPEQRRIVAEIEKQFTRLDAGVAALRRTQANLKRYRAAVLKAACEGRLVPTEAELARKKPCVTGSILAIGFDSLSHGSNPRVLKRRSIPQPLHGVKEVVNSSLTSPTKNNWGSTPYGCANLETGEQLLHRILLERRKSWTGRGEYKNPVAPDHAHLTKLPPGWIWATLDAIAAIKGGLTKDQKRKHTAGARLVPYLRVANVQRGYLDLTEVKEIMAAESEVEELRLERGDILFNEGGDRDKLGRGWIWNGELPECIHQNHVFRARVYVSELNPKFISWYANTFGQKFFFDEGKHTTNLASISVSKLKSLPIPIPPPSEQARIVAETERRLSIINTLDSAVETALFRGSRLQKAVLQSVFGMTYPRVHSA